MLPKLIDKLREGNDLVIGSRTAGRTEAGALTWQQRGGNRLVTAMLRLLYGLRLTDIGPFRAIRAATLRELEMEHRTYGWPVEMVVKAANKGYRIVNVPVTCRRRRGRTKVSGTVRGSVLAGYHLLSTTVMVRLGRVEGNQMTNLVPSSRKLEGRALRILSALGRVDEKRALAVRSTAEDDATPPRVFGVGLGTLILTANVVFLGCYTFGCHSLRHLVGGVLDVMSGRPVRKNAYRCVSCLNRWHMKWAWVSLIWVGFTDLYVRMLAMGVWSDLRLF